MSYNPPAEPDGGWEVCECCVRAMLRAVWLSSQVLCPFPPGNLALTYRLWNAAGACPFANPIDVSEEKQKVDRKREEKIERKNNNGYRARVQLLLLLLLLVLCPLSSATRTAALCSSHGLCFFWWTMEIGRAHV